MKWSKESPENFYFHVGDSPDGVMVIICPASYFNEYGCVYDNHLEIESLLPDCMEEMMECMFHSFKSAEDTRQELLKRKFSENEKFTEFCHSAFEIGDQLLNPSDISDINWLHSPLTKEEKSTFDKADSEEGEPW